jgi:hypothetical protein
MGDGGAYFLGSLIALISIGCSHKGSVVVALVAPLFVLALPIIDTSMAILRRGLRGLPLFRPDRQHLHHRLAQIGFSRRKVVLSLYSVTLVFLVMAFFVYWSEGQLLGIMAGLLMLVLLVCARRLSFARRWFEVGRVVSNSLQMREEIQYALTLNKCLKQASNRVDDVEGLWPTLVFTAERLGFVALKLKLADGEKIWHSPSYFPEQSEDLQRIEHMLRNGNAGVLELAARCCGKDKRKALSQICRSCPCVADQESFIILSELMAEGWLKATERWHHNNGVVLKFQGTLAANYRTNVGFLSAWNWRTAVAALPYSRNVREDKNAGKDLT